MAPAANSTTPTVEGHDERDDTVIIRVLGGLGNQLFQYALGRRLTHDSDRTLLLDTSWYDRSTYRMKHFADLEFKLDKFETSYSIATDNDIRSIVPGGRAGTDIARRLCRYCPRVVQRSVDYYLEIQKGYLSNFTPCPCKIRVPRGFTFEPSILDIGQSVYLDGFWQTEKYFNDIERVIRRELSVNEPITGSASQIQKQIEATNSVGVHIRRGDYVKLDEALPPSYFESAMSDISSRIANLHFYVFSDDIGWAQSNISTSATTLYVTGEYTQTDCMDLQLMSLCDHNIISNSTFSWWGAWLGETSDGIIYAPSIWLDNQSTHELDIVPNRWKVMDVS